MDTQELKISRQSEIKKLDTVFSQYIRLYNSDEDGICKCCTCNRLFAWNRLDNGHFVGRGKMATRFDEKNCHPQCRHCNWILEGNQAEYERFIKKSYGDNMVAILKLRGNEFSRPNEIELKTLQTYYRNRVKQLKNEKGIV